MVSLPSPVLMVLFSLLKMPLLESEPVIVSLPAPVSMVPLLEMPRSLKEVKMSSAVLVPVIVSLPAPVLIVPKLLMIIQ
jgi:hypothetical protein